MWQADKSPDAPGRLENLKELVVAMAEFENLGGFLEHVSLVMDNAADSGGDMVNLMTLHSAKGLEFDTVFLPGWEEGLFPNQRAMEENGLSGARRGAPPRLCRADPRAAPRAMCRSPPTAASTASGRVRSARALSTSCRPEHVEIVAELGLQPRRHRLAHRRMGERDRGRRLGRAVAARAARRRAGRCWSKAARRRGAARKSAGSAALRSATGYFTRNSATARCTAVEDNKLAIDFDIAGDKKVMDAFVEHA